MDNDLRNLEEKASRSQFKRKGRFEGGAHTDAEMHQQPRLWLETYQLVADSSTRIENFLNPVMAIPQLDIILTGAGSSAFIGKILEGVFRQATGIPSRAIATTDLLTHPQNFVSKHKPLLLISFARSGNSPESTAAFTLLSSICDNIFHLVITCNSKGKLANGNTENGRELIFLLPEATDDKSLVMTSSFTCMLVAGLLIARIKDITVYKRQIELMAEYGRKILDDYSVKIEEIAQLEFERVVCLGSGPLQGAAEESQLKVQELTDGKVVGKHDSYLGFRHGPKAVINAKTLIVYLFSNDPYAFSYEADLVKDVNAKDRGLYTLGIIETCDEKPEVDCLLQLASSPGNIDECLLAAITVLPAQLLGFFTCLKFDLKPDNPSKSGTITRIVEGVNIYPYKGLQK